MTFVTTDQHEAVQCSRCGSVNAHAEKRGFSLATGFLRSNQILLTCLKCSHRFRPARGPRQDAGFARFILLVLGAILLIGWMIGHSPAHAGSTTQHDAPTTRFYTPDGKSAGTASTYGNTTTFYGADGRVTGRATAAPRR